MSEKELIERDSDRDVWQETLDSVRSIKAGKVGRVETVQLLPVVEARQKTGLSQSRFAELLGISVRTLQIGSKVVVNQVERLCHLFKLLNNAQMSCVKYLGKKLTKVSFFQL